MKRRGETFNKLFSLIVWNYGKCVYLCAIKRKQMSTATTKTYSLYRIAIGKNTWSVMIGDNLIMVTKTSLPRHMQFGKTFTTWAQVESHYKDANLKAQFLIIQTGLVEPTETLTV